MNCRECIEFLMEYLDGGLCPTERAVFEEHLGECPPCVDYLEMYRRTVALGKAACSGKEDTPAEKVPERLIQAILAARKAKPD